MEPLEETTSVFSSKRYQSTVEKLVNFEMLKMLLLKKKIGLSKFSYIQNNMTSRKIKAYQRI